MYVTTEITIDFQRPRQNTMQVVQDDTTRKIRLILKNGGNDYDIASDLGSEETWVGAVAYLKPDGHGGVYDTTKDGEKAVQLVSGTTNQFDVLLVGQVFTAAGWTQVNVKFYNADFSKVLSTFAIDVNVQRNAASDYESEDYSNMQSLGAIRAELLALKADTEQDVTDEYAAAAQETPGLTYEQFFMSLPNGRYRIVERDYIHNAEVVTVDEGQYCKVDVFDHDGYCETTIYTNGTAAFKYVDGPTTGRIITMPVQVPTPVNPTDAANKAYVDAMGGLSDEAKDAILECFAHVAWTDEHGQDYYDALESALYPPADLVSISAVFAQGQTVVYDTDSLDVLKPMLTVTAHYSDATSETVTTYTLSGTLTVGTSTITVSYGGKTAAFEVSVTEKPTIGSLTAGTEVTIMESNVAKPWIYLGQDANDNCILIRKNTYGTRVMNSSVLSTTDYDGTSMDVWLSGDYQTRFSQALASHLSSKSITYTVYDPNGSPTSYIKTISRSVYLPSMYEMGFGGSEGGISYLDVLKGFYNTTDAKTARIAKNESNTAVHYWSRTATTAAANRFRHVREWGDETYAQATLNTVCTRPMMSLLPTTPIAEGEGGGYVVG